MSATGNPQLPRWDFWLWCIGWAIFFPATATFLWFFFARDELWALGASLISLFVGLFGYMFWTQWLASRKRRRIAATFCHANGHTYRPAIWSSEVLKPLAHIPLFQRGEVGWRLKHHIRGERDGFKFQVFDFKYTTWHLHVPHGGIEAGRTQTVLLWMNPPGSAFVLDPRIGLIGGLKSWIIGDAQDYASLGLQEVAGDFHRPPNLESKYRVWIADPDAAERTLPITAREGVMTASQPWTIESIGGAMAIYRPGFQWPTESFEQVFWEVWNITQSFVQPGSRKQIR